MTDRNAFMYDSNGQMKPEYQEQEFWRGLPRQITTHTTPETTKGHPQTRPPLTTLPVPPLPVAPESGLILNKHAILEKTGIPAHQFLDDAVTTMKQRAQLRDKPEGERSMATIVEAFNALTGKTLTEAEGWEFMLLLKMVRGRQGSFHADDYVDGAAYFGLLGECESKTRGK